MLLTALFIAAVYWSLHIALRIDFKYIRLISYACYNLGKLSNIISLYWVLKIEVLFLSNQYADMRKKFKCNSYVKNDLNMGDRRKWEREWFGSICFNQRARLNMWFMNIFDIIYTNCMVDFSNGKWKHLWNRVCILRWKISIVKTF